MKHFLNAQIVAGFFATALVLAGGQALADGPTVDQLKADADHEWSLRDYTTDGSAHALAASQKYQQLVALTTDADQKLDFSLMVAETVYFVGDNSNDKDQQKTLFQTGMDAADVVLKAYGITDTGTGAVNDALATSLNSQFGTNKIKMDRLAYAFYWKSASLGQWGQTDVLGALFRWGELKNMCDFMGKIALTTTDSTGKATTTNYRWVKAYASYRIVGRGLYVIPPLLGGDKSKSETYLGLAVKNTIAVDASGKTQVFSWNGYNNVWYTDTLRANGKNDQANALLKAFVAADPHDQKLFPPDLVDFQDTIRSQKTASDILSKQ